MHVVQTLGWILAGLLYMAMFGYPVVKLLLPAPIRKQLGHIFVLPVGYLICCLTEFLLSGSLNIGAERSVWIASTLFLFATAYALRVDIKEGINYSKLRADAGQLLWLTATVFLVLLWPLFYYGADTYLGAVNPDYFAGLVDNSYLLHSKSVFEFEKGTNNSYPIDFISGSISASGRFASGMFAIALQVLFHLPGRTALTLSIALFLICLPLSIFIFAKVVLGFDDWTAKISSWLIGIAGSIGLSYIYFYLGQNSGLAAVPLIISTGYLAITEKNFRLTVLAAILINALLFVYFGMLPYALAPLGILALYALATKQVPAAKFIALLVTFIAISLLINVSILDAQIALIKGWTNVIGQTLQGQYFLEFLTEAFFPYFLGVVVYPGQSSMLTTYMGIGVFSYALVLTPVVAAFVIYSTWRWSRQNANRAGVVTFLGGLVIYAIVWWMYSFKQQYGYAVFKMASWLQFMLVPMAAYGIKLAFGRGSDGQRNTKGLSIFLAFASTVYISTNLATTLEYGRKGLGDNAYLSYIVNNFEMSGNRDYFELEKEVGKIAGKEKSVGLIFVDSIQNFWVSYYLRDHKLSLLSHEMMPGDDENLPDIQSNEVVDYYGNRREAFNPFFHGATDDYYLTWSEKHLNQDIAITSYAKTPLWENNTFRLFSKEGNPNILITGRGFYRLEYSQKNKPYWEPERHRWTAVGGEFFFLNPSRIGANYSLIFDVISGYEHDSDARTIELWLGKEKFDEFVVQSAARYISKPFPAHADVNKITVLIKERVGLTKRPMPLWNKDIPYDYRQLNVMMANVRVVEDGQRHQQFNSKCQSTLTGKDIQACALAFNGIQLDRWIGKSASLMIANEPQKNHSKIIIGGSAPDFRGLQYPLALKFIIQGQEYIREIKKAGAFSFELPLVNPSDERFSLEIIPAQAKELRDEYNFRRKILTQSILLDSISLQ